jgi:hypothetical protein
MSLRKAPFDGQIPSFHIAGLTHGALEFGAASGAHSCRQKSNAPNLGGLLGTSA